MSSARELSKIVKHTRDAEIIGVCLNCGKRITFCGKPFTADIVCYKCLYINVFLDSRQATSGHW